MRYVRDRSGRFAQRPHFDQKELDDECESVITQFLSTLPSGIIYPIPTDALTKLIERDASDLDLYADLSAEGTEVQGVTEFIVGKKPIVRIASVLSEQRSENRLRTTLTHEFGHIHFHRILYEVDTPKLDLVGQYDEKSPKCKRDAIFEASEYDWMEWQAGYACGAILMPASEVKRRVRTFCAAMNLDPPLSVGHRAAQELERLIAVDFAVSVEAAHVRLMKLGLVTSQPPTKLLF